MARMTPEQRGTAKAVKAAALKAQTDAAEATARQEWPERLMCNLERATKLSFDLTVADGKFCVRKPNADFTARFSIIPVGQIDLWGGGEGDWYQMEELERTLEDAEEEARRVQRKMQVRAAALSKLTPEERMELGL